MTSDEVLDIISNKLKNEEDLEEYSNKEDLRKILFYDEYPNILRKDQIGLNLVEEFIGNENNFYRDTIYDKNILENIEIYQKELNKLGIVIYCDIYLYTGSDKEENFNFISTNKTLKEKAALYGGLEYFLRSLVNG